MENFKLRAHHGMCLAYFIGKGYSSNFVQNMSAQKEYLETNNPVVEIVCELDQICAKCPNNKEGKCTSNSKVVSYDAKVLEYASLENHVTMHWIDFFQRVNQNVLSCGKRKEICHDCCWNALCEEIGKNL